MISVYLLLDYMRFPHSSRGNKARLRRAIRLVTNIKTNKDIGHKNRTPCSLKMVQVIFLPLLTITLLRIEGADSKKFVNFVV